MIPVPITPEIRHAAALIWAWCSMPGNQVGGTLHIVVDDHNPEPEHILWCIDQTIEPNIRLDPSAVALLAVARQVLANALLALPDNQSRIAAITLAQPYTRTRPPAWMYTTNPVLVEWDET